MLKDFLAGVRVLDLCQYIPGAYVTLILSDFGAEVIKVEPPAGDPLRHVHMSAFGAPEPADGVSPFYRSANGNKTVVIFDLKEKAQVAEFEALVAVADVLLESFRPGVFERLGLGRDRLRAINPRVVHCAFSGYGQTGPARLKAGHDLNYMAMCGGLIGSGVTERPVITSPPVADNAGSMNAALTITAALHRAQRTDEGAYLDVSMAEPVLGWQIMGACQAQAIGREPDRAAGMLDGGTAYYQIYETEDGGFVTVAATEAKFWANLGAALGHPEWADRQNDPVPQTDLIAEVAAVFKSRPRAHWEALLAEVETCFQTVLTRQELLDDPHIRARGMVVAHGGANPYVEFLYPAWVDGTPPPPRAPFVEESRARVLERWSVAAK